MTVKELIEKLKKLPEEASVMHQQQKFYKTEANARMAWNKRED